MKYRVHAVADRELPEGIDRVIVERPDGPPVLIIAGEPARCWEFLRAWEATQQPEWQPTIRLPLRLVI